jgi:uncharacterized protein with HEPN domain
LSSKKQATFLADIVENAKRIASYIAGFNEATFSSDQKTVDAVERCLERICEATINLDDDIKAQMPLTHPWRDIRHMGNLLRHRYAKVSPAIVWQTITLDVPSLTQDSGRVLKQLEEGEV